MFPPQLTHYFIMLYSSRGDVVADCWAGVGTVPLQAGLDGRLGVGSDISPEAWEIMYAKLHPLTNSETTKYLDEIELRMKNMASRKLDKLGLRIGMQHYYHKRTLGEVLKLRDLLRKDRASKVLSIRRRANFVTALMLGILHGDRTESLSINMDCSKAISPVHIISMQKKDPKEYRAEYRNAISCLRIKAAKVLGCNIPEREMRGFAYKRKAEEFTLRKAARLVITSPPYLAVHGYAYDNRARLWFLGFDYKKVQKELFSTSSLRRYLEYLGRTLARVSKNMLHDSTLVLVLGDVRRDNGRVLRIGEVFANYWLRNYSKYLALKRIVVDRIKPTRRRYFNLAENEGIKCERILVFEKGQPHSNDVSIDWNERY